MMKHYIDAEKLIAELRRQKHELELSIQSQGDYGQSCHIVAYDNILSLITSLQQEQPDNEDIDKVAQELYEHLYELKRRNNVPTNLYDKQEIIDLWKAGIEYGRNHPKQEQPNNMIQWTKQGASAHNYPNQIVEDSSELLAIAREQFIKDGYIIEKKAFHDAVENISNKHRAEMSVEYSLHCKIEDGTRHAIINWEAFQKVAQKFIDIGKAEALEELKKNLADNDIYRVPEWLREVLVMAKDNGKKEALKDLPRWRKYSDSNNRGYGILGGLLLNGDWLIELDGLEKLPKED